MQNIIFSLLINGLLAGLLLATMIYCRRLDARIKILQDSKSELARIIREFDESTQRATQSIADIHTATNRISENIQHKIDKANFLADDLEYMIEKGQKLAGKVDMPARAPMPAALASATPAPSRSAEPQAAAFVTPEKMRSLQPSAADAKEAAPASTRVRSRAEQEIMSALGKKPKAGE